MSASGTETTVPTERTASEDDAGAVGQSNPDKQPEPELAADQLTASHRKLSIPTDDELNAGRSHEAGYNEDDHETTDIPYLEPAEAEDIVHPPDFRPFFTVIEDLETNEHIHPNVHYMFADDDPDLLTAAALETLSTENVSKDSDEVDERIVVVDIAASGKEVVSVSSLSPQWQALKTKVTPAPSWGGGGDGTNADQVLMLRISGQEVESSRVGKERGRAGDIDGLLRTFDERLIGLDEVLGSAASEASPSA